MNIRATPCGCLAIALVAIAWAALIAHSATAAESSTDGAGEHQRAAAETTTTLGEIVVTAEKREERLQEVPIPVTALSAEALVEGNQVKLSDYYMKVPGLSIAPGTFTSPVISIRGITTGSGTTASTVGIMVDGVPYGSSAHLILPDFDPGDLTRVEVLRGPQGTLYGASSMGGLIDYITTDPSTRSLSGRVEAGTDTVYNGAELGYTFRASVNVPLSDTWAVRVSGYTRLDPGYVDNPVLHIDGINVDHASGLRLAALWSPNEATSLKLNALYQQTKGDATSEVNVVTPGYVGPALGDLQQNYIAGVGPYSKEIQAYSAIFKSRIGIVDLTSVSAYSVFALRDSSDATYSFGSFTQFGVPGTGFTGFGVAGTPLLDWSRTSKYTEELRFSASLMQNLDGLLGLFYTHEFTAAAQALLAEDIGSGAIVGQTLFTPFPSTYEEYALFADLTYHVTERFDVQFGARESDIQQTFNESYYGVYDLCCTPTSPYTQPPENAQAKPFTYLVTPRFRITPDLMVYARAASGYRAGGVNAAGLGVPPAYQPDKTKDFEIGVKGDFLDRRLTLDASVYYIDWKNIQLNLVNPKTQIEYSGNAAGAKSEGVELSIEARPATDLRLAAWVAYNDAALTEALPSGPSLPYGVSGDRLPYSARFSGNFSVDQEFPVSANMKGFAGLAESYTGAREDIFTTTPQRQHLSAYARTDLRAGVRYERWTANLYVNNLADRRGPISGGLGNGLPTFFYYIEPRIVGLSVSRTF